MLQKVKKLILLAKKCLKCFYHTLFLEFFYSYQVVPVGLRIKKSPCLPINSEDFDKSWRNALQESELILMNALIEEHAIWCLMDSLKNVYDKNDFNNWLYKLNVIIEKQDIKLKRRKIKKNKKMAGYDYLRKCVLPRFEEHQTCCYF